MGGGGKASIELQWVCWCVIYLMDICCLLLYLSSVIKHYGEQFESSIQHAVSGCHFVIVSPWKLRFDTRPVHEIFVMDSGTGTGCYPHTFPISNLPPMVHTRLHLNTALSEGQAGAAEYFVLLGSSCRYSWTLSAVDCTYCWKGWCTKTVISESWGKEEEAVVAHLKVSLQLFSWRADWLLDSNGKSLQWNVFFLLSAPKLQTLSQSVSVPVDERSLKVG